MAAGTAWERRQDGREARRLARRYGAAARRNAASSARGAAGAPCGAARAARAAASARLRRRSAAQQGRTRRPVRLSRPAPRSAAAPAAPAGLLEAQEAPAAEMRRSRAGAWALPRSALPLPSSLRRTRAPRTTRLPAPRPAQQPRPPAAACRPGAPQPRRCRQAQVLHLLLRPVAALTRATVTWQGCAACSATPSASSSRPSDGTTPKQRAACIQCMRAVRLLLAPSAHATPFLIIA